MLSPTSLFVLFPGDWAWRIFLPFLFLLMLIYLAEAYRIFSCSRGELLGVACGISVPDHGSNQASCIEESGILTRTTSEIPSLSFLYELAPPRPCSALRRRERWPRPPHTKQCFPMFGISRLFLGWELEESRKVSQLSPHISHCPASGHSSKLGEKPAVLGTCLHVQGLLWWSGLRLCSQWRA